MFNISDRNFYILNALLTAFALSFLIWLIFLRQGSADANLAVSRLPALNAALNATGAVLLIAGLWAIKNRKELLHKNLMLSAFIVSGFFLLSYVYYHSLQGDTKFLGQGWVRPVYFFILVTHIIFSMMVFPLVLSTIYFGLRDNRKAHRRVARITFPMWLYVSVTGVVVFFLLRNYS